MVGAQSSLQLKADGTDVYVRVLDVAADQVVVDGTTFDLPAGGAALLIMEGVDDRVGTLHYMVAGTSHRLVHISSDAAGGVRIVPIPLWTSVIPPLVAILLALLFKEVVVSLFMGVLSGAFIAGGLRFDSLFYGFRSVMSIIDQYLITALNDSGHLSVIVFSLLIGGMVAIISKNGGMAGVVLGLSKYARSAKSSQFITWLLGVSIFFDDYANTLIVGNTMRSVTDKYRVSREKLAYIVDSTAAPVAAVAFITTWIGAELGYIDDGMQQVDLGVQMTPYAVFISSLKYSFYPILTLIFIVLIIRSGKDYGPMLKAERRARSTGQVSPARTEAEDEPDMEDLSPVAGVAARWYNAVVPVAVVIMMTILGLLSTGYDTIYQELTVAGADVDAAWSTIWSSMHLLLPEGQSGLLAKMGKVIGSSDSYTALLWASLSGVVVAIAMTVAGKIMSLFDTMHWMVQGFKTMMPALIILTLAWTLAGATETLHTADYISQALSGAVHPYVLPGLVYVMAAVIAFSTGSSWSTMAILYPIAIPTTVAVCVSAGLDAGHTLEILLNVIATVLAASVLGDHCSPISDTTILSSLASDCNHIDHVRTQLPYALTVGSVSLACVTLSAIFGGGWLLSAFLVMGALVVLYLVIDRVGQLVEIDGVDTGYNEDTIGNGT